VDTSTYIVKFTAVTPHDIERGIAVVQSWTQK